MLCRLYVSLSRTICSRVHVESSIRKTCPCHIYPIKLHNLTINAFSKTIRIIKTFPMKFSSFLKVQNSLYIVWASFRNATAQNYDAHMLSLLPENLGTQRVLTHLSLASFLWDIGKQNSPRCDPTECGVPSGAILFA